MKSKCRGFTLIELMVVVVVVAILSAIAIPSYKDYVLRARITQAISWLASTQTRMEQCYQDNHAYTNCCPAASSTDDFGFGCVSANGNSFTLTATGKGPTTGFVYTVDQANSQQTTGAPAGWNTGSCWITKKGQTC